MTPVKLGVIEEQLEALAPAFLGQLRKDVPAVRGAIHDVPVAGRRVVHRETVVVFARDRDVPHASCLGHRDPLGRIERDRIEQWRQFLVVGRSNRAVVHDPLAVTEDAVHAPVDEQAELCVLEPGARLEVVRGGSGLRGRTRGAEDEDESNGREKRAA